MKVLLTKPGQQTPFLNSFSSHLDRARPHKEPVGSVAHLPLPVKSDLWPTVLSRERGGVIKAQILVGTIIVLHGYHRSDTYFATLAAPQ